jgi:hypothetical protein
MDSQGSLWYIIAIPKDSLDSLNSFIPFISFNSSNSFKTEVVRIGVPRNRMYSKGVQCSAVQCSAVQCSAVQCSAVQCGAVQCSAVRCSFCWFSFLKWGAFFPRALRARGCFFIWGGLGFRVENLAEKCTTTFTL